VKEGRLSKLSETGAGRFFELVVANAGVSTRPAAATAATHLALLLLTRLSNGKTPCS
jgi:hypothetical protein